MKKTRVLIVDDSAVIRTLFGKILASDPEIEVVGSAPDPYVARELLVRLKPDVMTLDVEMPRMDGLTFLEKVMEHYPTRTIVISSLSTEGAATSLRALEIGAIDVMAKPAMDVTKSLSRMSEEIASRVKAVARARIPVRLSIPLPSRRIRKPEGAALERTTHQVLAIASSTGGTEALKSVLSQLPPDIPGTLIVQHMPPVFTKAYAESLQRICSFEVKEAEDGERVLPGKALLAPGNFHMELVRRGAFYYARLHQQPLIHGIRPAADHLMRSVAKVAGSNAIGVVLTGMGRDGAQGLLEMRNAGSFNIAQDEATCVIFGMPKEAISLGAIHSVLPLDRIPGAILDQMRRRAVA